jgi:hypothetical protein
MLLLVSLDFSFLGIIQLLLLLPPFSFSKGFVRQFCAGGPSWIQVHPHRHDRFLLLLIFLHLHYHHLLLFSLG